MGTVILRALLRASLRTCARVAVEIITGVERRRRWPPEETLRVLAELETPGASVADVARRHDISRGLLWGRRRQARHRWQPVEAGTGFLPLRVAPEAMTGLPLQSAKPRTAIDSTIEIQLAPHGERVARSAMTAQAGPGPSAGMGPPLPPPRSCHHAAGAGLSLCGWAAFPASASPQTKNPRPKPGVSSV